MCTQKKWPATLDAYRNVLKLDSDYPEAYAAIGEALYELQRPQEAIVALERAIKLDPEVAGSRVILGKIFQQTGQEDRAVEALEAADRIRPGDQEVVFRLFRIYHARQDAENSARMKQKLDDLVTSDNQRASSGAEASRLNTAAIELEKNGNQTQALEMYEKASAVDGTNIVFQRNAALLLCKMGRTEEAIERLHQILSVEPDDAQTAQILAIAQEISAGKSEKREGLRQTSPSDPNGDSHPH